MPKGLGRSLSRGGARSGAIRTVSLGSPAVGAATSLMAATALAAGAQAGFSTGLTSPAVPRNVTVKGNASGITGNVVINGTNREGVAITETIALSGASEVVGNKAFATVTSVDLPAETHAGTDTVSIGMGAKLGLPIRQAYDRLINAYLAGVREATRPTVAVSSSAIESNTVTLSSTLNASAVVVDLYD
jgi:hypothetical protein